MHHYFSTLYDEIGEDGDLLKELIFDFLTIFQDNIDSLTKAIANNDFEKMEKIAHKLKGSSMNFDFKFFSNATEIIEYEGKDKISDKSAEALIIVHEQINLFEIAGSNLIIP